MGLLDYLYSAGDSAKRKIRGMLSDPSGYLEQIGYALKEDMKAGDARRQRMIENPSSITQQDTQAAMDMAMALAPFGMTVWHGSPHKFDKFDMSKIGTGEGAQAYGHGLYFAENKDVAKQYANDVAGIAGVRGSRVKSAPEDSIAFDVENFLGDDIGEHAAARAEKMYSRSGKTIYEFEDGSLGVLDNYGNFQSFAKPDSQLYKVDIPDEAVSRFLDWDKPLSKQAPEVQKVFADMYGVSLENFKKMMALDPDKFDKTGREFVSGSRGAQSDEITSDLYAKGIPGIRYLDGGSRGSGAGTSNFVLFDDSMARILERNNEATGLKPWEPGEWESLFYKDPFVDTTK